MSMFGALLLFTVTSVFLSMLLLTIWALCRAAAEVEPEPVIDLGQLEAELSMEFHDWKRAA